MTPAAANCCRTSREAKGGQGIRVVVRSVGGRRLRRAADKVEGDAGSQAFPEPLRHADGLAALGRFVRSFHDAVAGFEPGDEAVYRIGRRPLRHGEIVCHGDLGYWNTVWRGGEIAGLIDWDFAEPGPPIRDVAVAAMSTVPLRGEHGARRAGLSPPLDRRERLATFCRAYGDVSPEEVVTAAIESLTLESNRLETLGGDGIEPWASLLAGGQLRLFETVRAWIAENRASLI